MLHETTNILKKCLREAIAEEFMLANKHVTKETIQTRIFEKLAHILGKTDDVIERPDFVYIHPEVSKFLSTHAPPDHPAFDENDRLLARRIYAEDRHEARGLHAFCRLLDAKIVVLGSAERNLIHRAFAVDGFRGHSLVEYVDHLRFPLTIENAPREKDARKKAMQRHVSGVRLLYEMFDTISVETLATALKNAMDYVESVDRTLRKMTNVYMIHVMDNFDDIDLYIDILKDSIQEKELLMDDTN